MDPSPRPPPDLSHVPLRAPVMRTQPMRRRHLLAATRGQTIQEVASAVSYVLEVVTPQGFWHLATVFFLDGAPHLHGALQDKEVAATIMAVLFLRQSGAQAAMHQVAASEAWLSANMSPLDVPRADALVNDLACMWHASGLPVLPPDFAWGVVDCGVGDDDSVHDERKRQWRAWATSSCAKDTTRQPPPCFSETTRPPGFYRSCRFGKFAARHPKT